MNNNMNRNINNMNDMNDIINLNQTFNIFYII